MLALLAAAALLASAAPARAITADPPPGWQDVTGEKTDPDLLVALKGPETSSFVLTRVPRLPLENRAAVRQFLGEMLSSLSRTAGVEFLNAGPLQTSRFENGLTFFHIRADTKGRERLVLGVADFGGETVLGTLISAVPDTLLPSILGGLKAKAAPAKAAGPVVSLDGQLLFNLPPGLHSRDLAEREKKAGFVAAIEGRGAELMVLKVVEEDVTPAAEQPQIVKQTVLSAAGVDAGSLSPVALLETPPGPDLVYAWARVRDAGGESRFLAGYMPWGYWGYSVLAKGAQPVELASEAFGALALGPSALPKVVASSPAIPVPRELRLKLKRRDRIAAAVAGTVALLLLGWRLTRRS